MVSRGSSAGSRSGQHSAKPPHLSHLLTHAVTEVGHAATVFGSGLHASMDAMRNSRSVQIPRRQPPLARARLASIDARTMLPRPHHPNPVATIAAGGGAAGGGVTREELGRATWTLLHATAAQFPERPTRRQQRDARQMVSLAATAPNTPPALEPLIHLSEIKPLESARTAVTACLSGEWTVHLCCSSLTRQQINALSRTYPCAECSKHFREIIRRAPAPAPASYPAKVLRHAQPQTPMWLHHFPTMCHL